MKKEKRNKRLFKYRETGKTFKEVAQKFNICELRARDIYNSEKKRQGYPKFRKMIPTRAQNVLLIIFNNDDDIFNHPEKIAQIPFKKLIRYKNMGIQSAEMVRIACKALGYPMV